MARADDGRDAVADTSASARIAGAASELPRLRAWARRGRLPGTENADAHRRAFRLCVTRDALPGRTAAAEKKAIAARDATSKPSLPLSKYAGTYVDEWYGEIAIEEQQDRLEIRFTRTPSLTGTLEHRQHDRSSPAGPTASCAPMRT